MSPNSKLKIDLTERFPHLRYAPIVEAVVEIRALAEGTWEEPTVRSYFEPKLAGYAYFDSPREFRHELEMKVGQAPKQMVKDMGLKGVRFRSHDQLQIVQLNRDGFVFSRLQPYEDWEQLSREAMRLWQFYAELARPTEIQRIGLRFINRMQLPPREVQFEDYIQSGPQPPKELELPFLGFMHHDTLAVPGYSYAINLIRTIQVPPNLQTEGVALILDIDVFTAEAFELREGAIEQRLPEMRWLKNKVFFGSITEKALEIFR
jgi:uncharacterized protein (TIGR04255 family)